MYKLWIIRLFIPSFNYLSLNHLFIYFFNHLFVCLFISLFTRKYAEESKAEAICG